MSLILPKNNSCFDKKYDLLFLLFVLNLSNLCRHDVCSPASTCTLYNLCKSLISQIALISYTFVPYFHDIFEIRMIRICLPPILSLPCPICDNFT